MHTYAHVHSCKVYIFYFLNVFILIYLFLVVLGLHRCAWLSLVVCVGFSLRWPLLLRSTVSGCRGFRRCGMWALGAHSQQLRHTCLVAPRLWDPHRPGINPCPLHRQVDSEPPDRGTFPRCVFLENSAIADQFMAVHLFCDSWAPWVGIPTLGGSYFLVHSCT